MSAKRMITQEQATSFLRNHRSNLPMTCFEDLTYVGYYGIRHIRGEWARELAQRKAAGEDTFEAEFYIDLADSLLEVAPK